MKKKKLFLLASLAALAMTSCSSFDEPAALDGDGMPLTRAGETRAAVTVTTETGLRNALNNSTASPINVKGDLALSSNLEINRAVTISSVNGGKIVSTAPIVCKASVTFKDLVIDATTPRGSGAINIAAEGIDVTLNNTQVKQNTAGTSDNMSNEGIGILYQAYTNVNLRLENNSVLTLPNNYVRGICLSPTSATVIKKLEIVDSKIIMGTDLSNPAVYARGISLSYIKTTDNLPILIKNSVIEGGYYAINTYGNTSVLNFNVENSTLNGRCGFNVWTPNTTATIKGGTIIGQNPYMGGWEEFANVKINDGANNCTFTFDGTTFEMYRKVGNQYNSQLMVMTGGTNTTLRFLGSVNVYDYTKQTLHFLGGSGDVTSINVSGLGNIHLVEANPNAQIY